ncbi:MAG: thioredoxin-dependent thiol peroxidase [Verrucomicrobiota bacterium]
MATTPEVGNKAPDFTAPVVGGNFEDGAHITLSELTGKKPIVLYFYPKDDTPGCTTQACAIRDHWGELQKKAQVFGISVDPVDKHEKFIAKHDLPFPLIADLDQQVVQHYGVWVEKNMYGKKFMGIARTTFVIDTDGKITHVFPKVKPDDHLDMLLEALD